MSDELNNAADSIDDLLHENRQFPPSREFVAQANVSDPAIYETAARDREAYWEKWAEELSWDTRWNKVLEWKAPYAKWFVGGCLNASFNCLDRHLQTRGSKRALIWEGEPGDTR